MSTLDAAAAAELVAALRGEARQGVEPIQVISAFQVPRVKYDPIRHAFYLAPGPAPLLGTAEVPLRPALFAEPQGGLLLSKSHIGGCNQPVWPGLLHPVGRPACSAFHLASGPAPLLRQPGAAAVSLLRSRKAYFVKVCPNCSPCCTFLACSAVPHMRLLLRQCISLCWLCRGRRVDQTGAGPEQEAGLGPARALLAGLPGAATPLLSLSTPASLRRPQSGGQQAARAALRQSTAGPRLRARAACPAMEGPTPVSALVHAAAMGRTGWSCTCSASTCCSSACISGLTLCLSLCGQDKLELYLQRLYLLQQRVRRSPLFSRPVYSELSAQRRDFCEARRAPAPAPLPAAPAYTRVLARHAAMRATTRTTGRCLA